MLSRCVQEVIDERTGEPVGDTPAELAHTVAGAMTERDPQAEILLDLICPSCNASFQTTFDVAEYFYRELRRHEHDLYREVHLLAFHYHWSEAAILRLTRRARLLYVELLAKRCAEGRLQ